MNAEYLFKKLGYKKRSKEGTCYFEYIKEDGKDTGVMLCISFNTRDKTMMCAIYRKGDLVSRALTIFPDEFKAIQEQMKELGWLDG